MLKPVELRPVPNLTDNSKQSIGREFSYVFGKLAEISELLKQIFDMEDIRTLFLTIDNRPARIRRETAFSPSGTEAIPFELADFDAGGYFDIDNPDGAGFPFGGVFWLHGYVTWVAATGLLQLRVNGTDIIAVGEQDVEALYLLKAGDFVELLVDDDVEGGLHSPVLEIEFVRPSPNPPIAT